jgi:hypothetical protein
MVLINAVEDADRELAYVHFWSHWTKEQVKIMNRWYGSGDCFISLPELFLKISVYNGVVSKAMIDTDYSGELPSATSWYLNNFF